MDSRQENFITTQVIGWSLFHVNAEVFRLVTKLHPLKTLEILSYYHEKSFSRGETLAARLGKKKRKKRRHKAKGDSACRRGFPLADQHEFFM